MSEKWFDKPMVMSAIQNALTDSYEILYNHTAKHFNVEQLYHIFAKYHFTAAYDDAVIGEDLRHDIFGFNHPVYTKVRDRVPSYYGENCELDNCMVADGCMLDGHVTNSVLFRQVEVKEGANVENCLIMNDAVIGENATLKNVILDKDVIVRPGAILMGTESNPIIVKKGEIV